MNDIQKNIGTAFRLISSIPVTGDAVEAMTAARVALRKAHELAGSKKDLWAAHKEAEKAEKKAEKPAEDKSDG